MGTHQQQHHQQYLSSAPLYASASAPGGSSFAMAAVPPPPAPPPAPNINPVVNVNQLQHHHILKPEHRSTLGTLMLSPTAPMQLNASRPPKLHAGVNMDFQESTGKALDERPTKRSSLFYTNTGFGPSYANEVIPMGSGNGDADLEYMDQDGYLLNDDGMMGGDPQKLGKGVRRLGYEQVKALERAFEGDNRLEPERKVKLASQLGLQPRQVAVWFQNRRARWKTKQLEKDYSMLKSSFDALKLERDKLLQEKQHLQAQLAKLKGDVVENNMTNAQGEQASTTLTSHSNILNQDKVMENTQNVETKSSSQKQENDSVSSIEDSESNGVIDEPSSVTILPDSAKLLPNESELYNNHHWRLPQNQHAYKPNIKSEETWENVEESGSFNAPIDWYW